MRAKKNWQIGSDFDDFLRELVIYEQAERVKRCVIHYAAPAGEIYPSCACNGGPTFREKIEKQFSTPFEKQPQLAQLRAGHNGC